MFTILFHIFVNIEKRFKNYKTDSVNGFNFKDWKKLVKNLIQSYC